ncbi:MAG: hypothetical protein ACK419_01435, partial [Pyrinomonadaceae bacterium]
MMPHESEIDVFPDRCEELIQQIFAQCQQNAPNYKVSFDEFRSALKKAVRKYLMNRGGDLPSVDDVEKFLKE